MTRTQKLTVALMLANLVLLIVLLARHRAVLGEGDARILRGRGLELVDAGGRVRVELNVDQDDVLFRMRDPRGTVRVKLDAGREGSGFLLLDETTEPGVQIIARRTATPTSPNTTNINLTGSAGQRRIITP